MEVPLRVDFGGGWLDVPKYSIEGAYIVNCAITPMVSLNDWIYNIGSGLGGSGAHAILQGKNPIKSELALGVGWQDPAVILETGLCVWRSGIKPVLELKVNPDFLHNKIALMWTGTDHNTPSLADRARPYDMIKHAGDFGYRAALEKNVDLLAESVYTSYMVQLEEGMEELPDYGEKAKKYCGGGFGGYALYIFDNTMGLPHLFNIIQPYMKDV